MRTIFFRFKKRFSLTFGLLLLESLGELLFPLFIGFAITDLLNDSNRGLIQLGILGVFVISIGALRRLLDSRAYAFMYVTLGEEISHEGSKLSTGKKTAQLSLLKEVVEFMENEMPDLFMYVIGLAGTLVILFSLSTPVAIGCVVAAILTFGLYAATAKKTTHLNARWNDEFEKRVDVLTKDDDKHTTKHLKKFMRWNIKLSDLETMNFSFAMVIAIALLLFSIATTTEPTVNYGATFAVVMYVYEFIEGSTEVPLYYQQWLRLREITSRINLSRNQRG